MTLGPPHVIATSVPHEAGLANVLVTPGEARLCHVPERAHVPHGTGDVLTAQIAARTLGRAGKPELASRLIASFGAAVAATATIIDGSAGREELDLVSTAAAWEAPVPLKVTVI